MWFLAYFLLHLMVYSLIRLEFLVLNWASLKNLSIVEILTVFALGLRFDLSAIGMTVGLCMLGLIWLSGFKSIRQAWLYFFLLVNTLLFSLNFADIELYNHYAKRFSKSAFYILGEGSPSNWVQPSLWFLIFVSVVTLLIYIVGSRILFKKFNLNYDLKNKFIISFSVLFLSVLMARGGLQLKPLSYVDAKYFDNSYANTMAMNSTFTLLKSLGKNSLQRTGYFEHEKMLSLLNNQNLPKAKIEAGKYNVVLVVMESLSEEYTAVKNPELTPYFNFLRKRSVSFEKSYANGRRSIEGIAAILSGIPALMEEPFINSEFAANQIIGLGTILRTHNYDTAFFHGAKTGSMHFDRFAKSVGIEKYYGAEQFPDQNQNDGAWGIYDEPFLQWSCQKMGEFRQPFFSLIFTLSSHQPYKVPEQYLEKFKDDRNEIFSVFRYADYAFEKFMNCAEKQKWFENTIFIITADHTGPPLNHLANFKSYYEVPLLFYGVKKNALAGINPQQFAQHIDILPTILDVLNIENKNKNYLSRSLLQAGDKVIALYADSKYELVGNVKNPEEQLKAIQQYFSEGMYDNRLYYPTK